MTNSLSSSVLRDFKAIPQPPLPLPPPPSMALFKPRVELEQENRNPIVYRTVQPTSTARRPPLNSLSLNVLKETTGVEDCKPETRRQFRVRGSENQTRQAPPVHISRRNERERNRVKLINMGFERLRSVVPCHSGEQLSKISTLRKAIWYIEHLDRVLHGQDRSNSSDGANIQNGPPLNKATAVTPQALRSRAAVARPTDQYSQQSASVIRSSSSSKVGAGEAVRMASWSSTDSPLGHNPRVVHSGGRPVTSTDEVASPIFPTQWGRSSEQELTSTPKITTTEGPMKHGMILESSSQDSGYTSLHSSNTHPGNSTQDWSTPGPVRTPGSRTAQPGYLATEATQKSIAFVSFPFYPWFGKP